MIFDKSWRASRLSSSRKNSRTFSTVISPWKSKYRFSNRKRTSSFTKSLLQRQGKVALRAAFAIPVRGTVTQAVYGRPSVFGQYVQANHRQSTKFGSSGAWQTKHGRAF